MSETYRLACADCRTATDSFGQKNLGGNAYAYADAVAWTEVAAFLLEHLGHSLVAQETEWLAANDYRLPEIS